MCCGDPAAQDGSVMTGSPRAFMGGDLAQQLLFDAPEQVDDPFTQ
jgi:hypothetical protein